MAVGKDKVTGKPAPLNKLNYVLRGLTSLICLLVGFLLVTGAGNLAFGVHISPDPVVALYASGLGLAMWLGGYQACRKLSWARTYRVAVYAFLALPTAVVLVTGIGMPTEEAGKGSMIYVVGFVLLASVCFVLLRRMAR